MPFQKPKFLTDKELNIIRGKSLVGHATPQEILQVFGHLDLLEDWLTSLDPEDYFGTEGWRHAAGVPE